MEVRDTLKKEFKLHQATRDVTPGAPRDYPTIESFRNDTAFVGFYAMAYTEEDPPVPPPPKFKPDEFRQLKAEYPCRRSSRPGPYAPAPPRRQSSLPPKLLALEDTKAPSRRAELRGAELVDATNDQHSLCRAITSLRLAIEDKKEETSSPGPAREPEATSPGEPSEKPTAATQVDDMVAAIRAQFPALAAKSVPKPGAKAKAKAKAEAQAEAGPSPKPKTKGKGKGGAKPPKAKGKGKGGAKPPKAKGKGKGGAKAASKVKKSR